jgi:hypothetical protein
MNIVKFYLVENLIIFFININMSSCSCSCKMTMPCVSRGKYTYSRYPIKTPISNWCGKTEHPSQLIYKTNGSYMGRNRRTPGNCSGNC